MRLTDFCEIKGRKVELKIATRLARSKSAVTPANNVLNSFDESATIVASDDNGAYGKLQSVLTYLKTVALVIEDILITFSSFFLKTVFICSSEGLFMCGTRLPKISSPSARDPRTPIATLANAVM
jgi:hypothetical protein